jgi:5-methylcytosine-specific restriction endonuclease McrA
MPRAEITFGPGVRLVGPKPRRPRLREQAEPRLSLEALAALDRELVRVAGGGGGHRLRVGEALNELSRRGWHHQLGFSSLSAYVQERCNQPGRWSVECCALARRLEKLPVLRAALVSAELCWSKVDLVARRATPETEAGLAEQAARCTVRQLRDRLRDTGADADGAEIEDDRAAVSISVSPDDAWLLEHARSLFDCIQSAPTAEGFLHWLVAEGVTSLREIVPAEKLAELEAQSDERREQSAAWRAQRRVWCEEAEARVEERLDLTLPNGCDAEGPWAQPLAPGSYATPRALDAHIRQLSQELATRDLLLGGLAERFWRSDGWRRRGYASERQYARERLGLALSAVKTKRLLARSAARLPAVAAAIEQRRIGVDAALLVTRVATERTAEAWVARAAERTIIHLREEVDAAELLIRLGEPRDQLPPDEATLKAIERERRAAGQVIAVAAGDPRQAPFAERTLGVLSQMSDEPGGRSRPSDEEGWGSRRSRRRLGLLKYRFAVPRDTREAWCDFEEWFRFARARLPANVSPVRFLAVAYCVEWAHELTKGVAFEYAYLRDGHRCQSPLCRRRDKTPHHLVFRSRGGGDEPENVITLCVWCHLFGLHQGLIKALPPASAVCWEFGRDPILIVEGRKKIEVGGEAATTMAA